MLLGAICICPMYFGESFWRFIYFIHSLLIKKDHVNSNKANFALKVLSDNKNLRKISTIDVI